MSSISKKSPNKVIRVVELFAGVGGFRIGLERASKMLKTIWYNQWEPSTAKQHAYEVYSSKWGALPYANEDIALVKTKDIPDHDLLVGGFPCQDYSVARTLSQAAGIKGKKGVLWWEIHRILSDKKAKGHTVSLVFLENVDRLLKSPISQRGRDFAIMLASLNDLGYVAEWRVINAAEYGMPQRRRRTYIVAYRVESKLGKEAVKNILQPKVDLSEAWLLKNSLMSSAFPAAADTEPKIVRIEGALPEITEKFNRERPHTSPFGNAGISVKRSVLTGHVLPKYDGQYKTLGEVLEKESDVPKEYYITSDLERWKYLKGAKAEPRGKANGFKFLYKEGAMVYPDPLDKPSRTIITSEGGPTPSRFKHVIRTKSGKLRRLTPLELERLGMFPDNHTAGQPPARRAFFMGNALVVGAIQRVGKAIIKNADSVL